MRKPFQNEFGGAQRGLSLHNFFQILGVRKFFLRELGCLNRIDFYFFQILGVRKPFQKELGCHNKVDFYTTFFQILGVRKPFPRELGCSNRG